MSVLSIVSPLVRWLSSVVESNCSIPTSSDEEGAIGRVRGQAGHAAVGPCRDVLHVDLLVCVPDTDVSHIASCIEEACGLFPLQNHSSICRKRGRYYNTCSTLYLQQSSCM